ncbi:1467_t:CDS:2 [Paraglomus occultum]|uniref:1467_t:CDS:1 n=1 Tax=Paraglomus occultum TaxID=144539 RepID=A0A9N8Z639_9GLOM|nr:1467_t:CDS:2 [Paraglomus occultum]
MENGEILVAKEFRKFEDVEKRSEFPGFVLFLVAESTTGALVSFETAANTRDTPEDIGDTYVH